ncbi:MAG: hypothetical protein AMXMBFR7_36840 [Planctomycetota bacterium]
MGTVVATGMLDDGPDGTLDHEGANASSPADGEPAAEKGGAVEPAMKFSNAGMPAPIPLPQPRKRVDLAAAADAQLAVPQAVESLEVRELRGVGATFTPKLDAALSFHGLAYKPEGEFEAIHQILAGPLLRDPRVLPRARRLLFVPAFAWATFEVVLMPLSLTRFGQRVVADLRQLQPRFPHYKTFKEWSDSKRRHVIHLLDLTETERDAIVQVAWPDQDAIIDALQAVAYDDINALAADNAEIRTLLAAKEVG